MKHTKIGISKAKSTFADLLEKVDRGQVFVITKRGRPVAELRAVPTRTGVYFGCDEGNIRIGDDFDAPLRELTT